MKPYDREDVARRERLYRHDADRRRCLNVEVQRAAAEEVWNPPPHVVTYVRILPGTTHPEGIYLNAEQLRHEIRGGIPLDHWIEVAERLVEGFPDHPFHNVAAGRELPEEREFVGKVRVLDAARAFVARLGTRNRDMLASNLKDTNTRSDGLIALNEALREAGR